MLRTPKTPHVVHQHQDRPAGIRATLAVIPAGLPGAVPRPRNLDYVYEFTELDPGTKLAMRTAQGPFPMQTTYTWADADGASTA